jgi:hypothetical protein
MYYQFDSKEVQLDPSGTYFGSDFVGKGSGPIIVAGAYDYEAAGGNTCALSQQTGVTCDATALAASRSNDNHVLNTLNTGAGQLTAGQITTALTQFAATNFGSNAGDNDLGSDLVDNTVLTAGSEALGIAAGSNTAASSETGLGSVIMYSAGAGFASSIAVDAAKTVNGSGQIAGVESFGAAQKHVYAEDGGEYGIRLGTYLDDVGTGVDLNFYYANYHSKQPYVRFTGQGNTFAGDYYALYRAVVTDQFGLYAGTALDAFDGSLRGTTAGDTLYQAIRDTAYGGTVCGAVLDRAVGGPTISALLGDATINRYTVNQGQRALYMDRSFGTDLSASGEKALIHNSAVCLATMNGIDAGNGTANDINLAAELTAAQVLGAITPLSNMTHQFIYPEDNQIVGASFSTNVGSTTVQGEISLRPDFPLATPASSQINQIADAAGTTQMLNWLAYAGLNGSGTNTSRGLGADSTDATGDTLQAVLWATRSGMDALLGGNAYDIAVRDFKRSSLPSISQATVTAGDYNSTPFLRYDVLSIDLGTTTSFTASDPITVGLGADSAAILTEIAMVQINELDNTRGYVARGGFAASGDDPSKCGGVTGGSITNTPGLASVQSLGASHVDALFGNGGYCEDKPGAEKLSLSYRVIGTATYNNFQNTRWALSPNFAFAHDPYGYGPASLGGFVEDRMSLSLGVNATSGGTTVGFSYTNNLGDNDVGTTTDRDYITASVSHSF